MGAHGDQAHLALSKEWRVNMSVSRRAQLVLMGLAAAGLAVSLAVSMLFWLLPDGRWFSTALIAASPSPSLGFSNRDDRLCSYFRSRAC